MDTFSQEKVNFLKLSQLIVEFCRDLLWDILGKHILVEDLKATILSNPKVLKNLNPTQKHQIHGVQLGTSLTKEHFDVSALYTLLRHICPSLQKPSIGWGKEPLEAHAGLSDDIERIHGLRNRVYGHSTQTMISNDFYDICVEKIKNITKRMDKELNKRNYQKLQCFLTSLNQLNSVTYTHRDVEKHYPKDLDLLRMVVVGKTGTGKSSTGNTITGNKNNFLTNFDAASVTTSVSPRTANRFGKKIMVCDTPGLFDIAFDIDKTMTEILKCINLTNPGPNAFILTLRCDVRFSPEEKAVITLMEKYLGEELYKYLIVLFTHLDRLEHNRGTEEKYIRRAPEHLKQLLRKCNQRYIFLNNEASIEDNQEKVKNLIEMVESIYDCNNCSHYRYCPEQKQKTKWFEYLLCFAVKKEVEEL